MNTQTEVFGGSSVALGAERQRVLRNTYALLAVSMIPTVLGAWVGVATGITSLMSPMIGLVVFLAGAFGFMFAIQKYRNSGLGVALLLGFTFFMGLMLSRLLDSEQNQEEFVQSLHHAYLDVRQTVRSYFVNLSSVRERVCYTMRISEYLFDKFLGYAYHQRLKIKISLEVDKLPDETQVMYVQREPVMVDGKYRNIIAIDLA